jgi:type IV secretory pathway ATPase VirB11/archaellum biosynthesis ATPase
MTDAGSTVVVIARRVDAGRRAIPMAILVGSVRDRVASSAARRVSTRRGNSASII